MDGEGERQKTAAQELIRREEARQEAEERIRLFPGCEALRVAPDRGGWKAVMTTSPGAEGDAPAEDVLARRPTLALLVDFFESHGGYARER